MGPERGPIQESSRRKSDLPASVSPVWYDLRTHIDNNPNFRNLSHDLKELIFCVAYTKYCHRKKTHISNLIRNPNDPDNIKMLVKPFVPFSDEEYYTSLSDDAERMTMRVLDANFRELLGEATGTHRGFAAVMREALFHLAVLLFVAVIPAALVFLAAIIERRNVPFVINQVGDLFIHFGTFLKGPPVSNPS